MAQPEMKAETRRVVETKLKMLEKAMDRRIALAHQKSQEDRKKA